KRKRGIEPERQHDECDVCGHDDRVNCTFVRRLGGFAHNRIISGDKRDAVVSEKGKQHQRRPQKSSPLSKNKDKDSYHGRDCRRVMNEGRKKNQYASYHPSSF